MEFTHLSVFALFCLTLVGISASQSGKDYWKSIWPNTPIPEALTDLWQPESRSNIPIRGEENKQYWTVFFEHDLYPGNKISLGFHKNYETQSKQESQSYEARTQGEKTSEDISQPFGAWKWSEKTTQSFGARTQGEKTSEEISQLFGAPTQNEKISQSFEVSTQGEKISQPFGDRTWGEKERQSFDNYCGHPSAIGEDKYCALSLKSMVSFAISKLGTNIKVISSSFAQNQDQYRVDEVKKIGEKAVICHRLNFKDIVFSCHQVNATTIYIVPLVASDGTKAKAVTVCHHDTRGMNPDHLYQVLKVKPGTVPICHFIGNKAIAWLPDRVVNEFVDHPSLI